MRHTRSLRSKRITPQCVFSGGNSLKMIGVYASLILTQMVNNQAVWYGTFVNGIAKAMRHNLSATTLVMAKDGSVSVPVGRVRIRPTLIWTALALEIPKQPLKPEVFHAA